ncbi:protein-glutamate O-methyltransferase CheR [Pendulispora brunnea]|uniref:Protein-glutamate O-methyltransferase CheR n=1 Tax=Pendulispora brunnea TaxID=2905690 RepID=A0ABZ2KEB7_9BACT
MSRAAPASSSGTYRALKEKDTEVERVEVELLLEAIFRVYGFDFRSYAYASIKRRLWRRAQAEGVASFSALQERVLHDPTCMDRLMLDLSIQVTSMFRDPSFFLALRRKVVPSLRTYPFIRVWHAGCSSGEEVFSLAMLLKEEGLYARTRIYATDLNETVIKVAKNGIFPLSKMQEYTINYQRAGGLRSFSEYYTARYDGARFDPSLMENVLFSQHNLVTDGSFSEFHLILCRNVMIYFDRNLQNRVLDLFHSSLANFGFLALGRKENLRQTESEPKFIPFVAEEKIFRRADKK